VTSCKSGQTNYWNVFSPELCTGRTGASTVYSSLRFWGYESIPPLILSLSTPAYGENYCGEPIQRLRPPDWEVSRTAMIF